MRVCLELAGYNWDEVWPLWSSPEPPPEDSVFADPAFWQVLEACLAGNGRSDEPFDGARIAEENRRVLEYVGCMHEREWSLPDPEPWEGPEHPGLLSVRSSVPTARRLRSGTTATRPPAASDETPPPAHAPLCPAGSLGEPLAMWAGQKSATVRSLFE